MRSRRHKVAHELGGRPLILRVLDLVAGAGADQVVVVLGHQADQVKRLLPDEVECVIQQPQLGTGHAVQVAASRLVQWQPRRLLVHYGDEALVRPDSLRRLIETDVDARAPIALLNARVHDPRGYGRVIRRADGTVDQIVEEVDATPEQRSIDEIWSGTMLLWGDWLWPNLERLTLSPKGEYYLPQLVGLALSQRLTVRATLTDDEQEVLGVNDQRQLAQAETILRQRTIERLLDSGVTIVDPCNTYIEPEVVVEPGVSIHAGCHLRGHTTIAAGCEIGPNSYIIDSAIGCDSRIWFSVVESANVGERVSVGPFSHLRPGAIIEDEANLGNYAEVKASRIGARTQMHHFSYVGDADIGRGVNIGAGTITVNYSSETRLKSRTVVEDDAALGSDTLLIAPVRVGASGLTGAGTVVTRDVPAGEVWVGAPARALRRRRNEPAADPPDASADP
jgi:bifunctional UDP-N-acetylglucosamine pyrophosphorylase/glucosamine-1-phosphate N-acetyltransferase